MNRLGFRAPAKVAMGHETRKGAPVVATGRSSSRPSLRLFRRRASSTPSLDELASPGRFGLPSSPESPRDYDSDGSDDGASSGAEERGECGDDDDADEEEATDDERARLRRARARALRMGSTTSLGSVELGNSFRTHHQRRGDGTFHEEDAHGDDGDDDSDDNPADGDSQLRLSSDVGELQRQVRALLHARIEAEDAWRRETARLQEQLQASETRVSEARGKSSKHSVATPSSPTPRERELLRLLIRIVGKEQIRALLTEPSATGAANARRRLVTRAKATVTPVAAASRQRIRHGDTKAGAPQTTKASETAAALLLSGTRRHEMSAAM